MKRLKKIESESDVNALRTRLEKENDPIIRKAISAELGRLTKRLSKNGAATIEAKNATDGKMYTLKVGDVLFRLDTTIPTGEHYGGEDGFVRIRRTTLTSITPKGHVRFDNGSSETEIDLGASRNAYYRTTAVYLTFDDAKKAALAECERVLARLRNAVATTEALFGETSLAYDQAKHLCEIKVKEKIA